MRYILLLILAVSMPSLAYADESQRLGTLLTQGYQITDASRAIVVQKGSSAYICGNPASWSDTFIQGVPKDQVLPRNAKELGDIPCLPIR